MVLGCQKCLVVVFFFFVISFFPRYSNFCCSIATNSSDAVISDRVEAKKQVANCSLALLLELATRFALTLTSFEQLDSKMYTMVFARFRPTLSLRFFRALWRQPQINGTELQIELLIFLV